MLFKLKIILAKGSKKILALLRVWKYLLLSDGIIKGKPIRYQPLLVEGRGILEVSDNVRFGVPSSSAFFSTYCFIGTRTKNSKISFAGDNWINNNLTIISEGEGVFIGRKTLIGANVQIYDSDFHDINPKHRILSPDKVVKKGKVIIENNVWIGNDVIILRGVTIGENSVIGAGSIVTNNIDSNIVAAGNPCKKVRDIEVYL